MHPKKVTPAMILAAQQELTRLGVERVMSQLETSEPALAEYLLEELGQVHRSLMNLAAPARQTQRVYRQVQRLMLLLATIRSRA
jgi:hypothetical protein